MNPLNLTTIILAAILGIGLGLWFTSRRMAKKSITRLGEEEFATQMRKGQLIDLRNPADFEKGHINGARNIPAATLMRSHGKLRKDLPVYLYDAKGKNMTMVNYLTSKGITQLYYLEGGLENWTGSLKTKKK
ncbi:MAG: rhodanese-like domain-containing protein [Turicibacter sp.]|nr:rhodanese-like domain-containing protein [Turicibacter sp.]